MDDLIKVLKYWVSCSSDKTNLITNYNKGFFDGKKSCCQDILLLLKDPDCMKELVDNLNKLED